MISILHTSAIQAQFEQKFSIDLGLGMIMPLGPEDFTYVYDGEEYTDPWIMSNFGIGFSFLGSLRYNFSRRFSLGASMRILESWNWYYEYYDQDDQEYYYYLTFGDYDDEGEYYEWDDYMGVWRVGFGVSPKYNFIPGSKFNPYLYLDLNINYSDIVYIDNSPEAELDPEGGFENVITGSFGFGFYPAIGIDYSINEKIGMFLHGGYSFVGMNENDWWDADLEAENFKMLKVELGVRFSFLKSKDI
ncbi:MAG: hypothetical protein JXB49_37655 [Bacteroidales bacterium]|nr:hypothetical protein [Bacteroidales bacterium]